jgi:hypothetical protein
MVIVSMVIKFIQKQLFQKSNEGNFKQLQTVSEQALKHFDNE